MHTLLANLEGLPDADWDTTPHGGGRTIRTIVHHLGFAYRVYASAAFGDGSIGRYHPSVQPGAAPNDVSALQDWLADSFETLVGPTEEIDEVEADRPRALPWGGMAPVEDIVRSMVHHTIYHAGEINHLRALVQGTDRWFYAADTATG